MRRRELDYAPVKRIKKNRNHINGVQCTNLLELVRGRVKVRRENHAHNLLNYRKTEDNYDKLLI